jgi:hypothetical protein
LSWSKCGVCRPRATDWGSVRWRLAQFQTLQMQMETLLNCVWSCESEWDFDDRLDLATRSQGRAA